MTERIEALRAKHHIPAWLHTSCGACMKRWPCDTYSALTLALEAETLRTALRKRGHDTECNFFMRWKEIGGYRCDCGWDALFPGEQERRDRAALGGTE